LLSETWPKRWRPWIAATLQTAVNVGVLLACFFGYLFENTEPRYIFLVGVLPALIVLWIRRAVPETEEWHAARAGSEKPPGLTDLFRGKVAKTTWIVLTICGVSLTAHWTFMFWQQKYIRDLPEIRDLSSAGQNRAAVIALMVLMAGSILGNYAAAAVARAVGYRKAVVSFCLIYGVVMGLTFLEARTHSAVLIGFFFIGLCQGVFGLFTMCLPPLFPTLLRTTGAGFCYNIGRLIAAGGTVFFGLFTKVGDVRQALLYAAILFIPAAGLACWLPEPKD
jgi:MFS family permease